jgi:hypothetical protein
MSSSSDLKALLSQLRQSQGEEEPTDEPAAHVPTTSLPTDSAAVPTSKSDDMSLFALLGSLKPVPRDWVPSEPSPAPSKPKSRELAPASSSSRRDVRNISFAQAVPLLGQCAADPALSSTLFKVTHAASSAPRLLSQRLRRLRQMKAEQERLEIEIADTRTRHRSEFERRIKQARSASVTLAPLGCSSSCVLKYSLPHKGRHRRRGTRYR